MSFRLTALIPAATFLAMGVAHAQAPTSTGGGGGMAYPDSLPSGQVRQQAPSARDTGSMQLPTGPGIAEAAPRARDTGASQRPDDTGGFTSTPSRRGTLVVAQRPDVTPAPGRTPEAGAMAVQPSAAPVPYTDFLTPEPAAGHGRMMARHHAAVHHAVMRHHAAAATPAADTTK